MWQNYNYTDPANPTTSGGSVEITNAETYEQLGAFPTPGFTAENLPSAKELLPWFSGDGDVFTAEAYDTKCWNRSLSQPMSCQEDCLEYVDLFNATWFYLGDLYCMQSYPDQGLVSMTEVIPPPGNVTIILTNQCSQYTYGPGENDQVTMYTLTDTFGNVYALQSATTNATTPDEWQELVNSAVYPPGWTLGTETLTEDETHYSYLIGNDCWLVILKDSAGLAWQQYVYGEPLEQSGFLSSFECPPLAKGADATNATSSMPSSLPSLPSTTPSSGGPFGFGSTAGQLALLALGLRMMIFGGH